ncbi:uncharacterized protein LOC131251704 [Magnolia sinica]|uniref:uncharacterized protein LOC131251704 n=1 Tax=Magnolia sinica TaxID=86752 RepID=UPI00265A4CB4|nr:uncharacterized protein LOC131251704 [Magnolia sinica]
MRDGGRRREGERLDEKVGGERDPVREKNGRWSMEVRKREEKKESVEELQNPPAGLWKAKSKPGPIKKQAGLLGLNPALGPNTLAQARLEAGQAQKPIGPTRSIDRPRNR